MKGVRPFAREDIPQVAHLHQRVFGVNGKPAQLPISESLSKAYADYFEAIFFQNPWYDESMPSLVFQDSTGRITGFLGVMPRRMSLRGRLINVAISSQFIVEANSRSMGVGVWLSKSFLSGPQDLSLTDEANNISRKLWEGLGGVTARLYSIHWTRVLRPSRYAASLFKSVFDDRRLASFFLPAANPVCNLVDAIAVRKLPHRFGHPRPNVAAGELNLDGMLSCLSKFSDTRTLWPEYNDRSLRWLLETIARKTHCGDLRKLVIHNAREEVIGWYVYHLKPGGTSNLLQVMARKTSMGEVLDHLFHDAWHQGSLAVSGRLEPQFMQAFSDKRCLFSCGMPWVLIYSHDPDLVESIHHGDALLSKLEGEWCMRFR